MENAAHAGVMRQQSQLPPMDALHAVEHASHTPLTVVIPPLFSAPSTRPPTPSIRPGLMSPPFAAQRMDSFRSPSFDAHTLSEHSLEHQSSDQRYAPFNYEADIGFEHFSEPWTKFLRKSHPYTRHLHQQCLCGLNLFSNKLTIIRCKTKGQDIWRLRPAARASGFHRGLPDTQWNRTFTAYDYLLI